MDQLPRDLHILIAQTVDLISDLRSLSRTGHIFHTICASLIPKLESIYMQKHTHLELSKWLSNPLHKYTIELALDGYAKLIPEKYYTIHNEILFAMLAFCGDMKLLIKASCRAYTNDHIEEYALKCASYNGHLYVIKWILSNCPINYHYSLVIPYACVHPHLHILDWAFKNHYNDISYGISYDMYSEAFRYGHISLLEWSHKKQFNLPEYCFNKIARWGHTHVLDWMIEHGYEPDTSFYHLAIHYGHPNVLQWALDHNYIKATPNWYLAVYFEHTNVLQWAIDHNYVIPNNIYEVAVEQNKTKVIKWFRDNNLVKIDK